ncbi:MAG: UbiD family decarboxylase domain-containing protein, partial [Bryobacteraceae bacterium]
MRRIEPEGVVNAMRGGLARRVKPEVIGQGEAPCREVVKTGDSVNLREFPALQAWNLDAGPYVNAGAFLVYDPD